MEVLIVGAGEMGRWFAEATSLEPAFTDRDPDVAAAAAGTVAGRAVPLDTDERFEAVCVAVPMSAARGAIASHAGKATEAVIDVTGVMAGPVDAMAEYAPELERLSLHPLFASENAPGNVAVVADRSGPVTDRVRSDLTEAGNALVETTPEEHDEAMETIQAKAHAAVLSFALAADDVPEAFHTPVSETLTDLAVQVTGGTPQVYAEIQSTFDGAEEIAATARRIADADDATFERLYAEASDRSNGRDTDGKGER